MKIIMKVERVPGVKNLRLTAGDKEYGNQIGIEEHQLPQLVTESFDAQDRHTIRFEKGGINYALIDQKPVTGHLNRENIEVPRVKSFKWKTIIPFRTNFRLTMA